MILPKSFRIWVHQYYFRGVYLLLAQVKFKQILRQIDLQSMGRALDLHSFYKGKGILNLSKIYNKLFGKFYLI